MNIVSADLQKYACTGLFLIIASLQTGSIQAQVTSKPSLHEHKDISDTGRQFLDANIEKSRFSRTSIQMSQLDPRLRLSQCNVPLTTTLAPGSRFSGKTTVHIRCNSTSPWTVYLSANIKLYGKVIQTIEPLNKGHILKKDNLIAVEEDLSRLRYGYFTDVKNLIGKQLKRRLYQNQIVSANFVTSPTLVKRGELVSIVAENTGFSVKMTGTAMSSGARGDHIRVKNTSSKRIVEGIVKEAGVVSIN